MKKQFIILVLFYLFILNLVFSQDIFQAAKDGKFQQVKSFVENLGMDVNIVDSKNCSLMYYANYETRDYLLSKGAVIDDKTLKFVIEDCDNSSIEVFFKYN